MGGGAGLGRAIALALAARGVRIVVAGPNERALGETVGEIAHGGGKARHVAGDARDPAHLERAIARAVEVFGGLDIAVDAEEADGISAECTVAPALARLRSPGRIVLAGVRSPGAARIVRELAAAGSENGITCNAVLLEGDASSVDDRATDLAELVVVLCGSGADRLSGQTLTLL